jgi:hypothetical protein
LELFSIQERVLKERKHMKQYVAKIETESMYYIVLKQKGGGETILKEYGKSCTQEGEVHLMWRMLECLLNK